MPYALLAFFLSVLQIPIFSQINQQDRDLLIPYRSQDKWGYCDTLAQVIIQPTYDSTGFFSSDQRPDLEDLAVVVKNGKYGAIDKSEKVLIDFTFDKISIDTRNAYCLLESGSHQGIALLNGKIVIPPNYDRIVFDREVKGFIVSRNGKSSFRDQEGRVIAPLEYDSIYVLDYFDDSKDMIVGIKGSAKFQIYRDGRTRKITLKPKVPGSDMFMMDTPVGDEIPEQEERIKTRAEAIKSEMELDNIDYESYKRDGYYLISKDQKVGLIRHDEQRLIPIEYDSIIELYIHRTVYKVKGGFISNNCLVRDEGTCVDLFWVRKNGKAGIINHKNEVVLPLIYDGFVENDIFKPILDNKIGQLEFEDYSAKMRFECLYESLKYAHYIRLHGVWIFSIYQVKKNGKWGFAGENGIEFFE